MEPLLSGEDAGGGSFSSSRGTGGGHTWWRAAVFGALAGVLATLAVGSVIFALVKPNGGEQSGSTFPSPNLIPSMAINSQSAGSRVVLNEFSVGSSAGAEKVTDRSEVKQAWVELFNPLTNADADVSGFWLRRHAGSSKSVQIPEGTVISPLGFFIVDVPSDFFLEDMASTSNVSSVATSHRYGSLFFEDPAQSTVVDSAIYSVLATAKTTKTSSYFRFPDGGFWTESVTAEPTPGTANVERAGGDPVWAEGTFEIHMFDAGQGDAQLVIFPSGFTILIDTCEMNWNSGAGAASVAAKLDRVLNGRKNIDVAVLSHLHLDHIGYVGYGGIWSLIEQHGYTFGQVIDRNAGKWVDANQDGVCDHKTEIEFAYAGTTSGTATRWLCYATDPANSNIYNAREVAQLCSTTQIRVPDTDGMVQIIAADGFGGRLDDGRILSADYTSDDMPPSENGFSIGLLIRFGDIEYVTAGDLDGADASSIYGYTYNDVESVVADRLTPGQTDIYRANHHGSSHSSNVKFVAAMRPTVSLVSCGVANSYGHPSQSTLDRLLDEGDVHITNMCNSERNYGNAKISGGDVVVRSVDGRTFDVESMGGGRSSYRAKPKSGTPGAACR